MKDKIYKDWQSGMSQKELENKYSLSNYELRQIIDQTPRERTCLACKTVFVAVRQKRYCCRKCQPSYYQRHDKPNKTKRKSKKPISLDSYLKTININDYSKLQVQETLKMTGR